MSITTSRQDVIWSYAGTVLSMCVNLLLLPVLIYFLDSDYLGLWNIYASVGSLAALLDFGFNPTIARNVAYVWSGAKSLIKKGTNALDDASHDVDFALLKRLQATCRALYLVIALIALIALALGGSAYIFSVSSGLDPVIVGTSWAVYTIAVFLNLYYGYFATLLRGVGAVKRYNQVLVLARSVQLAASVAFLFAGLGIIAPAIAYLLYGFLLRYCSKWSYLHHEGIGKRIKAVEGGVTLLDVRCLFSTIWYNAWRDGLVSLSNYLASQATVIICSLFLSLAETGTYSISVQLVTATYTIASVVYTSSQPAMQSAFVEGRIGDLRAMMAKCMFVYLLVYSVLVVCLVSVGVPLLSAIKPETVFSASVLLFLGVYYYFFKREQLYASFISNANEVPYMPAFLASSALGILLCLILCGVFGIGIWGLLWGQAIPQLVYNCWKWPNVAYGRLETNCREMFRLGLAETRELFA